MNYNLFIKIDGKRMKLENCSYAVQRSVSDNGQPQGNVRAGEIHITVAGEHDSPFWKWAADKSMKKNGSIEFADSTEEKTVHRTLDFTDAYAVHFGESCSGGGESMESVTLTAKSIKMNNATIVNPGWTNP